MSLSLNTPYIFEPSANLVCAGQPDPQGFREAAAQGFTAVANLRPEEEMEWDEAALMAELGMDYLHLPVASPADLSRDNARRLNRWMAGHAQHKVLVHCASSNRVGALLALAAWLDGSTPEEAIDLGRRAGLTRLEPVVRDLLSEWHDT